MTSREMTSGDNRIAGKEVEGNDVTGRRGRG